MRPLQNWLDGAGMSDLADIGYALAITVGLVVLVAVGIFAISHAVAPTKRASLNLDEWKCTNSVTERRSTPILIGKGIYPIQGDVDVCVEYRRLRP